MQRFNTESLKIDIPDEKFAITAFIAGLGVQSKDLMFSISKNPQASMAEVLAKAGKYINCDTPKPGGPLTTRQPAEYKWRSGYPTPL